MFCTHTGHYYLLFMLFGMTSVPSVFQSIMSGLFFRQIRCFCLVFLVILQCYLVTWQGLLTLWIVFSVHHMQFLIRLVAWSTSSVQMGQRFAPAQPEKRKKRSKGKKKQKNELALCALQDFLVTLDITENLCYIEEYQWTIDLIVEEIILLWEQGGR